MGVKKKKKKKPGVKIARTPKKPKVAVIPVISPQELIGKQFATRMNIIRFVAMCSIVWGHSIYAWEHKNFSDNNTQILQAFLLQMGRMGTTLFFLISGYFLSSKLSQFTIIGYLKYRLHSVIIPWLIFVSIFVLLQTYHLTSLQQWQANPFAQVKYAIYLYWIFIFHATYWFIPVSIISSLFLIFFKKYINQWWFGTALGLITLFYCINLYHAWIPADHTKAILGYTFFMWLGIQVKTHVVELNKIIISFSWPLLLGSILLIFIATCIEGLQLTRLGCLDPFASIRFTNSILALLLFIALLKTNKFQWIQALKPQNYMYGVYLVHCIIISEILPYVKQWVFNDDLFANIPKLIAVEFVFFVSMLIITYLIVKAIKNSRFYFLIGRAA